LGDLLSGHHAQQKPMPRESTRDKPPRIAGPRADYGEIVGGERFDTGSYAFGYDGFTREEGLNGVELMFVNSRVDLLLGFPTPHVGLGGPSHATYQKTATGFLLKMIVPESDAVVAGPSVRQRRCAQSLKPDGVDMVG
jgi:hypothetical protein